MRPDPTPVTPWRQSLRRIVESAQALVRNRLELFAVELQEEKLRVLKLLIWLASALVIGGIGMLIGLGLFAYWLWTVAGFGGVIALVVILVGAAAGILWGIRQQLQTSPPPFAHTVAEFRKDGACLKNPN